MSTVAMTRATPRSTAKDELRDPFGPATRRPDVAAALLLTLGLVIFAAAATVVETFGLPAMLLATPLAISLSCAFGAYLVTRHARGALGTAGMDPVAEQRLLDVAAASRGRVTITGIAYTMGVPLRTADAALTALVRAGYVAVEADPASGVLVYVFPEIEAGLVPWRVPESFPLAPGYAPAPALAPEAAVSAPSSVGLVRVAQKSRETAAFLAFFGGVIGAHKFYLGRPVQGLLYCFTFWTLVPVVVGFVEGIGFLAMSDQRFELEHNTRLVYTTRPAGGP